jgi:hypothetical protein
MYMSDLRHIHDPVLSSLKMEGIFLLTYYVRSECVFTLKGDMKCVSLVSVLLTNVKGKGKVHLELATKVEGGGASGRIALVFFQPQR